MTMGVGSSYHCNEENSQTRHEKPGDRKQVRFCVQQTAYFSNSQPPLEQHERKALCWYSDAELGPSRDDARRAIEALQERAEDLLTMRYDATDGVCLRGLEKYADAAAKFAGQKRLVCSVLQQQYVNNKADHVALVSRTLSQPFKDVARYYAAKSAEEASADEDGETDNEAQRRKERESAELAQHQEVATVLLWFVDAATHKRSSSNRSKPVYDSSSCLSSRKTGLELVQHVQQQEQEFSPGTPPEMVSKKRSLSALPIEEAGDQADELRLHRRNVKPCVRVITE